MTQSSINQNSSATPGLFCFECGYDLRATQADQNCPECGLAVGTSVSSSMLWAEAAAHGPTLRSGLILLAISLFMIPVIPLLTMGVGASGSEEATCLFFALMVTAEHVLWLLGVWKVCGLAASLTDARAWRRTAAVARAAAVGCAAGAITTVFLLVAVVIHVGIAEDSALKLAAAATLVALAGRVMSLLGGSRAVVMGLRGLRCGATAKSLRAAAIFGVVASVCVGLGTLSVSVLLPGVGSRPGSEWMATYLLIAGVPSVWLAGLAGGIVCTVAATKVSNRLRLLKAAAA